jgi:phospholipid transport system substrate-binding protein
MQQGLYRLLLIFSLCLGVPAWVAASTGDPEQLVRETAGKILTKIDSQYDMFSDHPDRLSEVVRTDLLPLLDMQYSARLILGRAGRSANPAQIEGFTEAMTHVLIDRYSSGLMGFRSSEQLEIMPLRGELNERATKVRTRVRLESGGQAPVDYVFRRTADGWKVFDVIIEGISYVSTYRNQIMPEVEANGLDAVIERLNNGELALRD